MLLLVIQRYYNTTCIKYLEKMQLMSTSEPQEHKNVFDHKTVPFSTLKPNHHQQGLVHHTECGTWTNTSPLFASKLNSS